MCAQSFMRPVGLCGYIPVIWKGCRPSILPAPPATMGMDEVPTLPRSTYQASSSLSSPLPSLSQSIENTTEICLVVTIASRGSGLRNFFGPLRISTIFIFRIQAVLQLQNHDKNAASKYKAPPNLKISTKFSFEHQLLSAIISAYQKLPKCTN